MSESLTIFLRILTISSSFLNQHINPIYLRITDNINENLQMMFKKLHRPTSELKKIKILTLVLNSCC